MKKIILAVTGSVAAIKTRLLTEKLQQFGELQIVMTNSAEYFVKAELATLQQRNIPVFRDQDEWPVLDSHYLMGEPILHIEMRRWADCMVIAPLDANTLAKIAHGMCDNLLTSIVRAWDWTKPIFLCPAMNTMMWENPPTADQIRLIRSWGATIIEPIEKKLACNDFGMGAMAQVDDIAQTIDSYLQQHSE
jgi:phosphopantothenoylcysteine decarboxylase